MLAVFEPGIYLDFDPNLLLVQLAGIYKNEDDVLDKRCGICIARSGIVRTHPTYIHFDAEAPDFLDSRNQWNYIHPDEEAKYERTI